MSSTHPPGGISCTGQLSAAPLPLQPPPPSPRWPSARPRAPCTAFHLMTPALRQPRRRLLSRSIPLASAWTWLPPQPAERSLWSEQAPLCWSGDGATPDTRHIQPDIYLSVSGCSSTRPSELLVRTTVGDVTSATGTVNYAQGGPPLITRREDHRVLHWMSSCLFADAYADFQARPTGERLSRAGETRGGVPVQQLRHEWWPTTRGLQAALLTRKGAPSFRPSVVRS